MSHFAVLVLVPGDTPYDAIEAKVQQLLEPYDENKQVPEYEETCHCVGKAAQAEAMDAAVREMGVEKFDDLRDLFNARHPEFKSRPPFDEEVQEVWTDEVIEPVETLKRKHFNAHPDKEKPDPTCGFYLGAYWEEQIAKGALPENQRGERYDDESGCGGTGKVRTTYNPKSKWDWYQIGGRWTGLLDQTYDPAEDENNYETCSLCGGTGQRKDIVAALELAREKAAIGQEVEDEDLPLHMRSGFSLFGIEQEQWTLQRIEEYLEETGCNGCQGEGKARKWPTGWQRNETDIVRLMSILPVIEGKGREMLPYSILDSQGNWHQRGEMGWFGCSTNEMTRAEWEQHALALLKEQADCFAVVVDCHI